MANPHKGEVEIVSDGVTYTWRLSTGAIAALEDHLNRGIFDIVGELSSWAQPFDEKGKPLPETPEQAKARTGRIRIGFCRSVFWAGFVDRHPDMSVKEAGDLMEAAGGLTGAMATIASGISLAFPDQEASGTSGPPNRAARRAAGTGKPS